MALYPAIAQEHLAFEMRKISIRELFFFKNIPCNLFSFTDGLFKVNIPVGTNITVDLLRLLLVSETWFFYIHQDDYLEIKLEQRKLLREQSRSISIGQPLQKAPALADLLGLNLHYFYQDTTDDELLQLIFQVGKNLAQFLAQNKSVIHPTYQTLMQGKHHYKIAQPLLSSLLLLGFLEGQKIFTPKEVENLFLASLLKDVGMGVIPDEQFHKEGLTPQESRLFSSHPEQSEKILEGRVPFTPEYFEIIGRHHEITTAHSAKVESSTQLCGLETVMVAVADILCAITCDRPYRKKEGYYQALEKIRPIMGKEYSQEFKYLVQFCRHFFI